jgi:hypothetical protein
MPSVLGTYSERARSARVDTVVTLRPLSVSENKSLGFISVDAAFSTALALEDSVECNEFER